MPSTDYAKQEQMMKMHPHMMNSLTKLISAMADVYNKRGKTSLFGGDKGLDAYKKFETTLRDLLLSLVLDGFIQRNLEADNCRQAIIDCIALAMEIWPNWLDAYSYAKEYFLDNKDQANARISDLMKMV